MTQEELVSQCNAAFDEDDKKRCICSIIMDYFALRRNADYIAAKQQMITSINNIKDKNKCLAIKSGMINDLYVINKRYQREVYPIIKKYIEKMTSIDSVANKILRENLINDIRKLQQQYINRLIEHFNLCK